MLKGKSIFALIPARSGSKGIKDKNIMAFNGKPMIAHSIEQAIQSRYIDDVYVSTDSQKYADIAIAYGASAPFLRPAEISGDHATDFEAFDHFVHYLIDKKIALPELIVHLRPTYPTRKVQDLDAAIEHFIVHYDQADSLRSVIEAPETPYKMWLAEGPYLKQLLYVEGIREPYNAPRQKLPKVYFQNASIDMMKTDTLLLKKSMTGDAIIKFEMDPEEIHDIDTMKDLNKIKGASYA